MREGVSACVCALHVRVYVCMVRVCACEGVSACVCAGESTWCV